MRNLPPPTRHHAGGGGVRSGEKPITSVSRFENLIERRDGRCLAPDSRRVWADSGAGAGESACLASSRGARWQKIVFNSLRARQST